DVGDEGIELLERAVVHVGEVRPQKLLLVGQQALFSLVEAFAGALGAYSARRSDRDDCVEAALGAGLVEKRHLVHGERGRIRLPAELFEPGVRPRHHERMEETLQPEQLVGITEDALADRAPVGRSEPLEEGRTDLVVLVELVDDLVARDRGGAVPREGGQRFALPRSDAARDRYGERSTQIWVPLPPARTAHALRSRRGPGASDRRHRHRRSHRRPLPPAPARPPEPQASTRRPAREEALRPLPRWVVPRG